MAYGVYNIQLILNNEQEERLEKLEKRFKKINNWNKEQILQFGTCAIEKNIDIILLFMEMKADSLTSKWFSF